MKRRNFLGLAALLPFGLFSRKVEGAVQERVADRTVGLTELRDGGRDLLREDLSRQRWVLLLTEYAGGWSAHWRDTRDFSIPWSINPDVTLGLAIRLACNWYDSTVKPPPNCPFRTTLWFKDNTYVELTSCYFDLIGGGIHGLARCMPAKVGGHETH